MANIKSQIKRIRTNEIARERNKSVRSALKTHIRKFNEAVASGDFEAAEDARRVAGRALDKAASAGVIHDNKAANSKSGMAVALAKAIAAPPMTEEAKKAIKKASAKKAPAKKAPAKAEAEAVEAPAQEKPKRMAKAAAKIAAKVKAPAKKAAEKKAPAKKAPAKAAKAEEAPTEEKPKRAPAKKKAEASEEPTEA